MRNHMQLLWMLLATFCCLGTVSAFTTTRHNLQPLSVLQRKSPLLFASSNAEKIDAGDAYGVVTTMPSNKGLRRIAKVEKFARLPVWPVWMGVVIFVMSRVLGNEAAAKVEDALGGRVCPNFFNVESPQETTSPFIMLVHHRHSFWSWDLIRYIQRTWILPEGFPAHAHRGFTTLTYFLKGGFEHRDSLGVQQHYSSTSGKEKHHSQWLFTGAGLLHEEMFDDSPDQELYQLWINVPSHQKMQPPQVKLLGEEECPKIITDDENSSETIVLAGSYQNQQSQAPIMSDMSVFHVRIEPNGNWKYTLPSSFESVILYIRQGSLEIAGTTVPVHHTAFLEAAGGDELSVRSSTGVDFLLLAGQPLLEPVSAQGSMVMNTPGEINKAYQDYQSGFMGQPWDHKLSNDEWRAHIQKYPARYQYSNNNKSMSER